MNTLTQSFTRVAGVLTLLAALAAPSAAADITDCRPECATPGDLVLLEGTFDQISAASVGGEAARVVRQSATRALLQLSANTPVGAADVEVTDALGTDTEVACVTVLPSGSPIVFRLSSTTAVEGQKIFAGGRRLGRNVRVEVTDSAGTTHAATTQLRHQNLVAFDIPTGVALGTATVTFTNAAGLDTGLCSPTIDIVAAGAATISDITPADRVPGQRVLITGTDLGPIGRHRVTWTEVGGSGAVLDARGFSDGYANVRSFVPPRAAFDTEYDVTVQTPGGSSTAFRYRTGSAASVAPTLASLTPDTGPPRTRYAAAGQNLFRRFSRTEITFDGVATRIRGAFVDRSTGNQVILTRVPDGKAAGSYDVVVNVQQGPSATPTASNPLPFDVTAATAPTLAVTGIRPDTVQAGRFPGIAIQGSGFGNFRDYPITVSLQTSPSGPSFPCRVIDRNDNRLFCVRARALPPGTYTVTVAIDPASGPQTADSPTPYTVTP